MMLVAVAACGIRGHQGAAVLAELLAGQPKLLPRSVDGHFPQETCISSKGQYVGSSQREIELLRRIATLVCANPGAQATSKGKRVLCK